MKYFILAGLLSISSSVLAFSDGDESVDKSEAMCYATAMIGYDAVINSRLGVKPDDLVRIFGYRTPSEIEYIKVSLGAYEWKKSPHQYANHIFYMCAKESGREEKK